MLANLVLEESLVRLLDVLRQVGVEHEGRNLRVAHLSHMYEIVILTFHWGGRIILYQAQRHYL